MLQQEDFDAPAAREDLVNRIIVRATLPRLTAEIREAILAELERAEGDFETMPNAPGFNRDNCLDLLQSASAEVARTRPKPLQPIVRILR